MTSREPQTQLARALRLLDMMERWINCDDDYNRLWYSDMIKDELSEFRERYPDTG